MHKHNELHLPHSLHTSSDNYQIAFDIFDTILPDANTLDEFGIATSTFTQTKNTIRMCIRKLLKQYSVNELRDIL